MRSKVLLAAIAMSSLLGATAVGHAQTNPAANAAAAQKQQDDGTNAKNEGRVATPPRASTTPTGPAPQRETTDRDRRQRAGEESSTTGASQGNANSANPGAASGGSAAGSNNAQ